MRPTTVPTVWFTGGFVMVVVGCAMRYGWADALLYGGMAAMLLAFFAWLGTV